MVIIEIPENPNCDAVDMCMFHDVEPPRAVMRVRLEREPGHPAWFHVTGWTAAGTPCPAFAQKVDDSGEGTAFLLHGGDAGLRLQPDTAHTPWQLDVVQQWGEPYMVLADAADLSETAASR